MAAVEAIAEYRGKRLEFSCVEAYGQSVPYSSLNVAGSGGEHLGKFGIKAFCYSFVEIRGIVAREFYRFFQIPASRKAVTEAEFEEYLAQKFFLQSLYAIRQFF